MFMSVISHGGSTMHWFSEAMAGTLMGYAIGTTVGRDFRRRWENTTKKATGLSAEIVPRPFSISVHFSW
jgi:membrane-associated phospholipid phosphatase